MPKKHINSPDAPKPIGPYSQAVISGGLLFASGQIPIDPATGNLIEGDIAAQTERVIKNLLAVLKEAKMGPENVVKTTVFLASMADFPKMNEVYEKYLGKEPPARSTVQAGGLPKGAKIEIDLIAALGRGSRRLLDRGRLGHLAGAEAARADAQPTLDARHHRADPLQIRVEPAVCHVVGVADPVPGQRSLAADVATLSHKSPIFLSGGALMRHPAGHSRPPLKPPSRVAAASRRRHALGRQGVSVRRETPIIVRSLAGVKRGRAPAVTGL